jgi:hypothetical protein
MLNLTDPVLEFNKSIREVEAKKAQEEKREEPAAIVSHSVIIEQISPSMINIIQNTTKQMCTLKDEMSTKKEAILAQAGEIQKKVNMLKNVKSVRINEEILKRHFMEALYFCHVLTESVQTFEAELVFWEQLVSATSACTIDTLASLPQEPNAYLTEKLESLKRLVKRNTKNIPIAYSRFNHLFQDQLRELNVIELYVKNNNIKLDNPSALEKAH